MMKKAKPDFICIGPTKTGSSWLHVALDKLPQVQMPRAKELRYFWGLGDARKRFDDTPIGRTERTFGKMSVRWRRRYINNTWRRMKTGEFKPGIRSTFWDIKYIFFPQTLSWYQSLFSKNKLSGDIDGEYIYYDQEVISRIKKHLPEVKVILILRDPLEKHWSQLRMWASHIRRVSLNTRTEDQIVRRFRKILNSSPNYSEVIELWRANFSDDQFYIAYYDDLKNNPREYLNAICDFLNTDRPGPEIEGLDAVVFKGEPHPIPRGVERAAHQMLLPDLKALVNLVDSEYPKRWLSAMEERIKIIGRE